jgi:hypothetical protein
MPDNQSNQKIKRVLLQPANCAVDLSNGSERGEYVNQDYILNKLGRPHRAVNIMYCYYPNDVGWPVRASVVHAHDDVTGAWDYPYDDYFTFSPVTDDTPFEQMRDIRRHGQDVILTLTVDPYVSDAHLIDVAKRLRGYGRMQIRINHEATGNWFQFNRRCTYQQVADFFVRFHKIIKEHAPNAETILCIGGIEDPNGTEIVKEAEFSEAVKVTDIWSVDKYLALHYGWPNDIAEHGGHTHYNDSVKAIYDMTKMSYKRFREINGGAGKPMVMSELNADGDVVGSYDQCRMVREFADYIRNDIEQGWFSGFTLYQFRDRGRLGLEIEDPNNKDVGLEQPLLKEYRSIIHDPYFSPKIIDAGEDLFPVTLRWGGSEDAEGIAVPLNFEKQPEFCEVTFEEADADLNLMLEINGRWFYKSPGCKTVDLMYAFFEKPLTAPAELNLHIFAPPASGQNTNNGNPDWATNTYTAVNRLPQVRLRFEPAESKPTRFK